MFNGIILYIGILSEIIIFDDNDISFKLKINSEFCSKVKIGDSVSCNGVCLTITDIKNNAFYASVSKTTLDSSNLGNLKENDEINIELPITLNDFINGHILQGHVDAVAKINKITPVQGSFIFNIEIPKNVQELLANKGSIGIDGVSITIANIYNTSFDINIISYTYNHTIFRKKLVGDFVNLETDLIARHIKRLSDFN